MGRNKKQSKPFKFNAMKVTNINTAIYWWLLAPAICLEKLETKIWGFRYYLSLSPPSTAICQEKLSCLNLTLKRMYQMFYRILSLIFPKIWHRKTKLMQRFKSGILDHKILPMERELMHHGRLASGERADVGGNYHNSSPDQFSSLGSSEYCWISGQQQVQCSSDNRYKVVLSPHNRCNNNNNSCSTVPSSNDSNLFESTFLNRKRILEQSTIIYYK